MKLKFRLVSHGNKDEEKNEIRRNAMTAQFSIIRPILSIENASALPNSLRRYQKCITSNKTFCQGYTNETSDWLGINMDEAVDVNQGRLRPRRLRKSLATNNRSLGI